MHANLTQGACTGFDGPIAGTFTPYAGGSRPADVDLRKMLSIAVAVAVMRLLVAKGHRDASWSGRGRRTAMLAQLHRELHAADDAGSASREVPA